ncbi:MAG: DUF839 domain-containing protein [Planctomycetes bacterium]|nr:DUF839 domain-containing protein [Planctomycetota bacterium]
MNRKLMFSRSLSYAAVAMLLGFVVCLTGCSGDDDDDNNGGGSSTSTVNTVPTSDPLSSVVAASFDNPRNTGITAVDNANNIADYVKALVAAYDANALPAGFNFPLANTSDDTFRSIPGLKNSIVARWLDPLGYGPNAPRFGANCDYIAYFGEGWDNDWSDETGIGRAPQWNGSGEAAWIWVNHEYVSGNIATTTSAPDNQWLTLATFMKNEGILTNDVTSNSWAQQDVDKLNYAARRQLGGSWVRIVKDPYSLEWKVDRAAPNVRYDATSNTLARIEGYTPSSVDHDDFGTNLPNGIATGINSDCSGGQSPWGTVVTCEENVQDWFGDLENCWTSNQQFTHTTATDAFAAGKTVSPTYTTDTSTVFGSHSDTRTHHKRDIYGFPVEMDPGEFPSLWYEDSDGRGHRKLGVMGRCRWENVTFATGTDWGLVSGEPIVIYGGDDRRGGRIFKFITSSNYTSGMSRDEVRGLLDSGTLYVAHFDNLDNDTGYTINGGSAPALSGSLATGSGQGTGRWIELSVSSTDIAPNAGQSLAGNGYVTDVGTTGTTVGAALQDNNYNGIGAYTSDNLLLSSLFTACTKIGVKELNRPEDVEWEPHNGILYVAFTNHTRRTALDANGVLYDPATQATTSARDDAVGSIFGLIENGRDPSNTGNFTFWRAWRGTEGTTALEAADPDNLVIDRDGGVWFGTDGNFGRNGTADAFYYLDLTTSGVGRAFRVVATPSDAECTGPCFASDMNTIFASVQHPGEGQTSTWPTERE